MRHLVTVLLCACFLVQPILSLPGHAEEFPLPGRQDGRMRYIAYNPGQVVRLSTAAGATVVVGFDPKETVSAVAVTDSKDLKAMPKGNFLFFKSAQALTPQPVIVLTTIEGAPMRRYVFEITITNTKDLSANSPDVYYSVQFTYPLDEAARHRAAAAVQRAAAAAQYAKNQASAQAREAHDQLQFAHQQMEDKARDPFSGDRNWRYIAQGDQSILPLEVFDNGYSTVFRFPGNVRIPALFVINPDGKEATPNYAVKSNLVQVDSVARGWRLRDGRTVLCIWNQAFDPVGKSPETGTTSPNVQRVVKEAPQ